MRRKASRILSFITAVTGLISALLGLFYTFGGVQRTVTNIYGKEYTLFGDGIYASNTLMKTGSQKANDLVAIALCILLITTVWLHRKAFADILRLGLLTGMLYLSTYLVTGISYNILFPLYLVQFSCNLFAFIFTLSNLLKRDCFDADIYSKTLKGTAVCIFFGGCSVLVWLAFIISAEITGDFSTITEIYTTEPTGVIDLGIILPCCIVIGIGLLKRKKWAYILASAFMMMFSCVGFCVIPATVIQLNYGIILLTADRIVVVGIFVMLAVVATILNIVLIRHSIVE